MGSLQSEPVTPMASPLPPIPTDEVLTEAQWKTLLSIADTVVPSVTPSSKTVSLAEYTNAANALELAAAHDDDTRLARNYLKESPSQLPEFKENISRLLGFYMPQDAKKQLSLALALLNNRAGCLVLTGYTTPFSDQPIKIRETIIKSWMTARLPLLRQLFRSMTLLCKQNWIKSSPTLPRILGFPRVPITMRPGKGFDFEFVQFPAGEKPEIIETDVVIVGSGCGGGVCAKNLAEAGHRVLVVDKSYHWPPEHLPMKDSDGINHMFMNGGFILSDDNTAAIIAGQAWGGGGTINWSASLQTQGFVRQEWAQERGLPFFTSAEFQHSLDRVCERMGVSADYVQHNKTNEHLLEGARKLGWAHKAVPQNTGGAQHQCGHCTFGCGSCEKQGPVVSYLPDAARTGATFIEGFDAQKILFQRKNGKQVAVGVRGIWTSRDANGGVAAEALVKRKVTIKANRVIVSGGTMQSPLLLLRSGLKNTQIGRNLYVHPVSFVGAIHEEETLPWNGPILTSVVSEYDNLDGKGHGVKLEATNMIPSSWLPWPVWKGGMEYKTFAAKMRHMVGYISIARDRDTGQVYPDPVDGRCRFKYSPSAFDKRHILTGLVALAKIQYMAGASEIFTVIPGMPHFKRDPGISPSDGINDRKFQAWLAELEKHGLGDTLYVSAHQMGTCRMSSTPKSGVVDPEGRVWGTEGLFVADASVFPSASGVNPMVTNMAISDWISQGIAKGLDQESGKEPPETGTAMARL